jgi:hypothetical protein
MLSEEKMKKIHAVHVARNNAFLIDVLYRFIYRNVYNAQYAGITEKAKADMQFQCYELFLHLLMTIA